MKHASLLAFLIGDLSPDAFGREIANEVNACVYALRTERMGSIMITDGPSQTITRDHARRLLEAVLSGHLTFLAANYTAECLIMSDDFEFADVAVAEALAFIADDSRPPTHDETEAMMEALS